MLMKLTAAKMVRWRLQMQQFNYSILHVAGSDDRHAVVDALSRLHGAASQKTLSVNAITRAQKRALDSQSEQLCGLKNPQADVSFGESVKGTLSDQNQTSPVHGASEVLPDEHGTSDQRASLNPASMPDSTGSWNGNMPPTIPEQSTQKNSRDHDHQPHKKAKRQPADKVVLTPETVKLI